MHTQTDFTSNPKFVQALSEGHNKMTLEKVLSRHYHIRKVLQCPKCEGDGYILTDEAFELICLLRQLL